MWTAYLHSVFEILAQLDVTNRDGAALAAEEAFGTWVDLATGLSPQGAIHLIGNGASASMASHFAADVTKNCGRPAGVFTDPALMTALANDCGYENAYAVALERYAHPGDLLIAISSSGASPNIVNACVAAGEKSLSVVTISGKRPDNALRRLGVLNFYVPAGKFSLAESAHAVILHHWIDRLEAWNNGNGRP